MALQELPSPADFNLIDFRRSGYSPDVLTADGQRTSHVGLSLEEARVRRVDYLGNLFPRSELADLSGALNPEICDRFLDNVGIARMEGRQTLGGVIGVWRRTDGASSGYGIYIYEQVNKDKPPFPTTAVEIDKTGGITFRRHVEMKIDDKPILIPVHYHPEEDQKRTLEYTMMADKKSLPEIMLAFERLRVDLDVERHLRTLNGLNEDLTAKLESVRQSDWQSLVQGMKTNYLAKVETMLAEMEQRAALKNKPDGELPQDRRAFARALAVDDQVRPVAEEIKTGIMAMLTVAGR